MSVVAIIPARLGSTRFPEKVLASETGRPMIAHVHEAASKAALIDRVVVATDDERVADAVRAFGGEPVMTSRDHPNGTSRLAEAADVLGMSDDDVAVNVQGDEPEIEPETIDAGVRALRDSSAPVATIASPWDDADDPANPNIVKVVLRRDATALYFSRAPIPHPRDAGADRPLLKHVGLYIFRRPFLREYTRLTPTPLERCETLEQLRILEHGHDIAVGIHRTTSTGIDTPAQYAAFVERWRRGG